MVALRQVRVLGCDGGYPGPGGAGSGYLVEVADTVVQLDAGPGTFANLQMVADPGRLDGLVLTHEHPDHWSDLESLAVWLLHNGDGRPLPVYAPTGLAARSYFSTSPVFEFHELDQRGVFSLGSLGLRCSLTDHGPPTMAIRVDQRDGDGRALVYSADTGPAWSVEDLGPGIALFVCEATYTAASEGTNRHLSGRQAGAMAARAGIERLVVTHRSPTVAADAVGVEAAASFGRPVEQAAVGRLFEW